MTNLARAQREPQFLQSAIEVSRAFNLGRLSALQAESVLLELGWYNVRFPNHGPLRASYLGVEYSL